MVVWCEPVPAQLLLSVQIPCLDPDSEYDRGIGTTFLGRIHTVLLAFKQMECVPNGSAPLRLGVGFPVPPTLCQGFKIRLLRDTCCAARFRAVAERGETLFFQ